MQSWKRSPTTPHPAPSIPGVPMSSSRVEVPRQPVGSHSQPGSPRHARSTNVPSACVGLGGVAMYIPRQDATSSPSSQYRTRPRARPDVPLLPSASRRGRGLGRTRDGAITDAHEPILTHRWAGSACQRPSAPSALLVTLALPSHHRRALNVIGSAGNPKPHETSAGHQLGPPRAWGGFPGSVGPGPVRMARWSTVAWSNAMEGRAPR